MAVKKKIKDLSKIKMKDFMFPGPEFFKRPKKTKQYDRRMSRSHEAAYREFIRWSATPRKLRDPKTIVEFEKRWKLPVNYVHAKFKQRKGFYEKKMAYFWKWMFDKFPDVVYAVYRRAIRNSTADAKIFAELVGKRMEQMAPTERKIQPFMMIGVPQEKIDALFTPESYEEAQEAEVVDD